LAEHHKTIGSDAMDVDAPKVSQNTAVPTVFLFLEGDRPLPATVFYQTDNEWIASELCKLFRAEYGQNGSDGFRFATVSPGSVTDFVRLQSAIDDLNLYQDPDPGIYDPEPTSDLLLRASYCFRAKEWEDALRQLRQHAVGVSSRLFNLLTANLEVASDANHG